MSLTDSKKSLIIGFYLFDTFLILDQVTKYLAATYLSQPIEIIPGFFRLTYAENTGVAWSFPIPQPALLIGVPLIIAAISYIFYKSFNLKHPLAYSAFALILAGSIGNYIDRIIFGHVIDFISVGTWPIFNLADAFITVGAFIILLFYARIERYA